jgi:hypothetical protein
MADEIQNATTLETETCSRCGGSGHYSYCTGYGTTCFKCRGRKVVYSKRGAAAADYLASLRKKRADQFQPGELIWVDGIPGFTKGKFYKVTGTRIKTAAEKAAAGYASLVDGVMRPPTKDSLVIDCDGYGIETSPETMERKGCTAEEKAATLKQALEYQATLTKMGKPRKVKAPRRADVCLCGAGMLDGVCAVKDCVCSAERA